MLSQSRCDKNRLGIRDELDALLAKFPGQWPLAHALLRRA